MPTSRQVAFPILVAACALLAVVHATEPLDLRLLDLQFKFLRSWFPRPATEVVIVGIDHESVERVPEPTALWHRHLGGFLSALARVGPAVVGVDIVLPDRSFDAIAPNTDKLLLKGLLDARRSYPLVLALTVDPDGATRKVYAPFMSVAGPDGGGYALFPLDRDGVVRRFDERIADGRTAVPTLVGQMARRLDRSVHSGYIDYSRGSPFEYIPMHRVTEWIERGDVEAMERAFRGKPVLLAFIDRFNDRRPAPVQLAAWDRDAPDLPGVLINAQALRNLLDAGFAREIERPWVAAAAALGATTWMLSAGAVSVALLGAALLLALAALSTWLLALGVVMPIASAGLAIVLGLGLRHAWDTAERLAERRRLRASFGGYVSPSVMQEILSGKVRPELGGVEKFVCVLFSDIRGYTTRSEGMSAPEVVSFLNRYFDRVVSRIHAHDGALICFMGDGIMAAFGAAKPLPNPCQSALDAAQELMHNVAELNGELAAEKQQPINIGIGLHAGSAVVGHIGSRDRHDYSVVGDVTNVASRLESLTKDKGVQLIVSAEVAGRLEQNPGLVDLGFVEIRGHSPMRAYGLNPGEIRPGEESAIDEQSRPSRVAGVGTIVSDSIAHR